MENRPKIKCKIENCNDIERTGGLCKIHYRRWLRHGDPLMTNKKYGNTATSPMPLDSVKCCTFENCTTTKIRSQHLCDKHYRQLKKQYRNICSISGCKIQCDRSKIYCNKHYQRFLKHGDPNIILCRQKGEGTINKEGYKIIYKRGHPNAKKDGRILEHRYVMSEHLKRPLFPNENVHHINGNKLDNRIENLELWVSSQPPGQRPKDLIMWAKEILKIYGEKYE